MPILGTTASAITLSTIPVSGYTFWLDANDASSFTFSSSNVVSQWADKSGNGNHATQATVGNQPTRESSVLNSKAGVRFTGNADKALGMATKIGAEGTQTFFLVLNTASGWTNSTGGNTPFFSSNAMSNSVPNGGVTIGSWTGAWANERVGWYAQTGGNQSFGIAQNSANVSSGGHIFSFNTTPSTNTRAIRMDNSEQSVVSSGNWSGSGTRPGNYDCIGNYIVTSGGSAFIGDICEVILYDTDLSDSDITSVYNYLKAKWGTP